MTVPTGTFVAARLVPAIGRSGRTEIAVWPRCWCGHAMGVHAIPERGDRSSRKQCTAWDDGRKCPCRQYAPEED